MTNNNAKKDEVYNQWKNAKRDKSRKEKGKNVLKTKDSVRERSTSEGGREQEGEVDDLYQTLISCQLVLR